MKTYIFHGISGSGKDTQIDKLVEMHPFEVIGTGDMFREMYDKKEPVGIEAYEYWGKGIFVPSEIVYKVLSKWILKFDQSKDWIFVSVIRIPDQVPMFDALMESLGRKLDLFVHFSLPEEVAIQRLSLRTYCPVCNATYHPLYKKEKVVGLCDNDGTKLIERADDKPEKIKQRMAEYNRTIGPILEVFKNRKLLVDIDASPSIDEIHKKVVQVLGIL